mmetsp:Transcript_2149/g.7766  ORF Transcript_2149/g.7766 Transcript_2149/m.7766 type:complete len:188 (+) Transcript_2149:56-619(+)
MPLYILSGAPGAGKTTIGDGLRVLGYPVVREGFMDLYHELLDAGMEKPLEEPQFIDKLAALQLDRMRLQQAAAKEDETAVYDRTPICTLALCKFMGRAPSAALLEAVEETMRGRFEKTVLFVVSLGYIETTDIRTLNHEQQLAFEELHRKLYVEHGFECIDIPPLPVKERVAFVADLVKRLEASTRG